MGMYCLNMLSIALELARENRAYEDVATKFFEHFLYIGYALNNIAGEGISLWNEEDQFFYDVLHMPDGSHTPLKVRSPTRPRMPLALAMGRNGPTEFGAWAPG